jgi:hypothetical protein
MGFRISHLKRKLGFWQQDLDFFAVCKNENIPLSQETWLKQ